MEPTTKNETDGRVVLITGSASGVGLATAELFARSGATVIAGVRSVAGADRLRRGLDEIGGASEVIELDVTSAVVAEVVADVIERHGRIDVLVSNAGVAIEGTLEDLPMEELERSLDVNFLGAIRVVKAVLPSMRAARSGRIIAVSSISGISGMVFQEPYAAAKFALEGVFECTAPVAATFGVHFTLVEPGPIVGDFVENPRAFASEPSEPYRQMYESFVAMRHGAFEHAVEPSKVAEVIHAVSVQDDPPLRVQDGAISRALAERKLLDVDGRGVLKLARMFK